MDRITTDNCGLAIRRMRDETGEFQRMVAWRNRPHVRQWWDTDDPPLELESAKTKYRPRTKPGSKTTACIIELDARPIGYLQFYRWSDYRADAEEIGFTPEDRWWGIDIFIGEPDLIGRGYGSRAVSILCEYLCAERSAAAVALTTDMNNAKAIRAYEKAGFEKRAQVLDTDTRDGVRVKAWLMVRACP
jgi:aminoglycoside 6'-N-acetyltransferase